MHRAGVVDYERFARDVLDVVRDVPVSFEVIADASMTWPARRGRSHRGVRTSM